MIKLEDAQIRRYVKYCSTLNYYDKRNLLDNLQRNMARKKRFLDMDKVWEGIELQLRGGKSAYKAHPDYMIVDRYIKKMMTNKILQMQGKIGFDFLSIEKIRLRKDDFRGLLNDLILERRLS